MTDRPRIDDLAASWMTGDTDPAVQAELEALLSHDEEARRRFLDHCAADMAIKDALDTERSATRRVVRTAPRTRMRSRRGRKSGSGTLWGFLAAAAAAVLVAVVGLNQNQTVPQPVAGPVDPIVTTSEGPLRVVTGEVMVAGQRMPAGTTLTIPLNQAVVGAAGAEVAGPDGLRLMADAGTAFTMIGPASIALDRGRVDVSVDGSRAPATSVTTGELSAHVVGTRFTVERKAEISEVAVTHGRVRVADAAQTQEVLLHAGDAVSADKNGLITGASVPLVLMDGTDRSERRFGPGKVVHLRADHPCNIRVEFPATVVSARFWLEDAQVSSKRSRGIEAIPPFLVWGDRDGTPYWNKLTAGTHRLRIASFRDSQSLDLIEERVVVLHVDP